MPSRFSEPNHANIHFMNPAVLAIARAHAAAPASSPPLADNAEAVATVQHVCVNTHLCG